MTTPCVNVRMIGPAGHGKATLMAALASVAADKGWASSVSDGEHTRALHARAETNTVTMGTSLVTYATPTRRYAHVDCPGYAHCIRDAIQGSTKMDGGILVVSAADGPMPQTRDHVLLARQLDVPHLVVALTKVDTVDDPELVEMVEREIRELSSACGFAGDTLPVVRVSALEALHGKPDGVQSVLNLMDALDDFVPLPQPEGSKPFLMPIDDVLSIAGRGTVVTGRVERGRVKLGEEIEIVGFRLSKKDVVIGIAMSCTLPESAEAGDHIGVLLRDTAETDVERGQVLCKPGSATSRTRFKGDLYVLPKAEGGSDRPFFNCYHLHFSIGTANVTGSATLPEGVTMLMPGDLGDVLIELRAAIALENGIRFAIRRDYRLIADGIVTDCRRLACR